MEEPYRHIAVLGGGASVMLLKKEAWTTEEIAELVEAIPSFRRSVLVGDPRVEPERPLWWGKRMTDDRPYLDDPGMVGRHLKKALRHSRGEEEEPLTALYRSVVIQVAFVLVAGLLFVFLPMLRRGPTELRGVRFVGLGLLYVSGLGYGYLAVETVLIHELVLFVGHPTYAVTVVILAMLLSSGIGSVLAGRVDPQGLLRTLRLVLVGVLGLGAIQAWVVPGLLYDHALGLSPELRMVVVGVAVAPLGLLMGMPFPLAMRLLPREAGGIVPWAWALNGWTSVVAGLATVLLSRLEGYDVAFSVALGAYLLALVLAGFLPRLRRAQSR